MKFDKSRVYTALNADELKVGSKIIVADDLLNLKESILKHRLPKTIEKVELEDWEHRFLCDDGFHYAFAYLVEESREKKLEWNDLIVGDVITKNGMTALVTQIDKNAIDGFHIRAGDWIRDTNLVEWKKVEE